MTEEDWPMQEQQAPDQNLLRHVQKRAAQTARLFQRQRDVCPLIGEGEDDPRGHHSEQVFVCSKDPIPRHGRPHQYGQTRKTHQSRQVANLMIRTKQILTEQEIALLASIKGCRWLDISGEDFDSEDFAWMEVRIETDGPSIRMFFEMEVLDIDGELDDYPVLHISDSPEKAPGALRRRNIYYHEKDQPISEIWILRETVICEKNNEPFFENVADTTIAFKLENRWIAFIRSDHWSDAFKIQRVAEKEEIELPDSLNEWESDLSHHYGLSREWIRVT
jgi:hypothetical protein